MLSHSYDYPSILETSQRINWKLEDVIAGRTFDFSRSFLPDSLAGVAAIKCLNAKEKLKLNQIRGFTYLSLSGLGDRFGHPGAQPAGRLPHHPAHRVVHPEALRGIGEGQRRRVPRPALLQPSQASLDG